MNSDLDSFSGMNVTIMGLGIHGGGAASALFFARSGANVTITDLRSEEELAPSIRRLSDYSIRYVLGRHETEDFSTADMVIKNPAVPSSSPFLTYAKRVETDISIFLSLIDNPVIAVTGSKGKSTVSSAVHHVLKTVYPQARLGGNITVSPLSFLRELTEDQDSNAVPVVLELSSWQLADLGEKKVLSPAVAAITNILPDHQNRYAGMDDYIRDKKRIYRDQKSDSYTVLNLDDPFLSPLSREVPGNLLFISRSPLPAHFAGGWLTARSARVRFDKKESLLFEDQINVPGPHNRINLLFSGVILTAFGLDSGIVRKGLETYPGIPHRLAFVAEADNITYINDSAATIPHATVQALKSFEAPVHLIMGGTDKEIDFSVLDQAMEIPASIHLLQGNATEKIIEVCTQSGREYSGPFPSMETAVLSAREKAGSGEIILLSPGCASFGMFNNEFHRGNEFVRIVRSFL